jgi:thiol-disulfide isomerase/thioredoxin
VVVRHNPTHPEVAMPQSRSLIALILAVSLALPLAASAEGTHIKGAEPAHISKGQPVTLADYLVPGKTTIFDFYSEYCPPCRAISPRLVKLHQSRDDIAVVKVDINRPGVKGIDWKSPVARQYNLESIPHFKVFGPDGTLKAEGDPAYEMVSGWLD